MSNNLPPSVWVLNTSDPSQAVHESSFLEAFPRRTIGSHKFLRRLSACSTVFFLSAGVFAISQSIKSWDYQSRPMSQPFPRKTTRLGGMGITSSRTRLPSGVNLHPTTAISGSEHDSSVWWDFLPSFLPCMEWKRKRDMKNGRLHKHEHTK
ncbi:hypothetical protein VTL71DRAFT_12453 [Oculimacula yallundae]|uniref:Transmembrane protein n=1 Tax=Oculimacula yallundae TaxID=86028 RepID=A0ABR4CNC5_9HELO